MVQFQLAENGKEHKAKILGWARKTSTKTKNWYNSKYIKPDDIKGTSMFIDLSTVKKSEDETNGNTKQKNSTDQ